MKVVTSLKHIGKRFQRRPKDEIRRITTFLGLKRGDCHPENWEEKKIATSHPISVITHFFVSSLFTSMGAQVCGLQVSGKHPDQEHRDDIGEDDGQDYAGESNSSAELLQAERVHQVSQSRCGVSRSATGGRINLSKHRKQKEGPNGWCRAVRNQFNLTGHGEFPLTSEGASLATPGNEPRRTEESRLWVRLALLCDE
jgi:hypothetical protein